MDITNVWLSMQALWTAMLWKSHENVIKNPGKHFSGPDTWFVNYERQNILIQVEILVNLKVALGVNKNLRFLEKMCSP